MSKSKSTLGKRKRVCFDQPLAATLDGGGFKEDFTRFMTKLSQVSFESLASEFQPQEIPSLFCLKYGYHFVEDLRLVLSAVPLESGPWRKTLVIDLITRFHKKYEIPSNLEEIIDFCLENDIIHDVIPSSSFLYHRIIRRLNDGDAESIFAGCLTPPTPTCFECETNLQKNNKPTFVTLYTLAGPLTLKKVELRCRHCDITYGISKYGSSSRGYLYYSDLGDVIEASDMCYIDRMVMNLFSSLSHHAWVSFVSFAEAYNEAIKSRMELEDYRKGKCLKPSSFTNSYKTELGRKTIQEAFWNDEIHQEILENKLSFTFFNPDCREKCMLEIDKIRVLRSYSHTCHDLCRERGCEVLYVTDGIWKLDYPVCLFKVPVCVNNVKVNLPDCCPMEPEKGKLFCRQHIEQLKKAGFPDDVLGFVKSIKKSSLIQVANQIDDHLTDEEHVALEDMLKKVSQNTSTSLTTADVQGSSQLLSNYPDIILEDNVEEDQCRKDTGGSKRIRQWSRGYQFIVSGGGHIEMFTPLYQSESPSQVFLFLVNFLLKKLDRIPEQEWSKIFIAYDNMCNLNRMKAAREDLPLPPPYNKVWQSVSKIIDVFHLKNHRREECQTTYNPIQLKEAHPSFNTQACEQTFAWLKRFHHILSSVPRIHNHFFLHRLIKRRNKYNSYCYMIGRKPVLPNVKNSHKQ